MPDNPADFLRDYLSKWGPDMDQDEYEEFRRSLHDFTGAAAIVAQLAAMQLYGEEFTPGDSDDAEQTLNALIRKARELRKEK